MKPKYQQEPRECFAACVASIMECRVIDVPPRTDVISSLTTPLAKAVFREWLHKRGCGGYVEFGFNMGLEVLLEEMARTGPEVYFILTGQNPSGVHSVVCQGGTIVHDPSAEPGYHTLLGPLENGPYHVGFLLFAPHPPLTKA